MGFDAAARRAAEWIGGVDGKYYGGGVRCVRWPIAASRDGVGGDGWGEKVIGVFAQSAVGSLRPGRDARRDGARTPVRTRDDVKSL